MLVNRINACGVPDENTLIIVAVGTHRSQTPEEFERIVGSEVVRRVRVINHDCDDMEHLRCVGQTPSGNEVYLSSYALDCVRLILTDGTVLHFLAGFGGGFPKDINLRQTAKSLHCALSMAEESSTIILAAECRDGFGDEQIRRQ